jgi:hypothetical protein
VAIIKASGKKYGPVANPVLNAKYTVMGVGVGGTCNYEAVY